MRSTEEAHEGRATPLLLGYLATAGFMILAALVELIIGAKAERKSLESIAVPLTAIRQETGTSV